MENTEAIWQQRLAKRREGTPWKAIIEAEGFTYGGTFTRHLKNARERGWIPPEASLPSAVRSDGKRQGLLGPKQDTTRPEATVEMSRNADTAPPEVHYGAVNEFDALPEGYAKIIQPIRPYTDAEEWVLNRSMELYGFIGTIVRDQYGRILDGHHRQRVARQRGLGVPFTIRQVKNDADAVEIARSLNTARRHYTPEERQTLAREMRDQGYVYQAIAEALGVGKATVYRDVMGVLRVRTEEIVPHETIPPASQAEIVPNGTNEPHTHEEIVPHETIPVGTREPSPPVKRVKRKGGGTYPAKRPNGTKPTTSPADRQLAQVINLLMSHAQQWNDQHWQAFLEVVQNLRGSREVPATE